MKLGACGDRCDACPRYIATATDDAALFEKILRVYGRIESEKRADRQFEMPRLFAGKHVRLCIGQRLCGKEKN